MLDITLVFGLAALTLSWLMPGHYPPWVTFQQQAMAALAAILLGIAALSTRAPRPLRWPWPSAVVVALSVVPLLQAWFGQVLFHSDALLSSLYLIAFALCMVVGATLMAARGARWLDELMAAVIVAALVSTTLALIQWLQLYASALVVDLAPGGRPYANLAQPNHLATLLALGGVGLVRAYERGLLGGVSTAIAVAFLGLGMVMTQSRTGWLFVVLLTLWWAWGRRHAALRVSAAAMLGGAALFTLAVLAWLPLNGALLLDSGTLGERLSAGTRWIHWTNLWDAAWRAPWLGYGWSQVAFAQQAVALDHPAPREMLMNSHNIVLDLVLWMGVPLGGLFAALMAIWLVGQIRRCGDADRWALLAATGAILLHAMLEYPLDFAYFLLPLGLFMGSLESEPYGRVRLHIPRAALALALLGMSAMLGWIVQEYVEVEQAARELRFAMARIGGEPADRPIPDVRLLDLPREFHRFWVIRARSGMSDAELNWMHDVSRRIPYPAAMMKYALAAGLNGHPDEASRVLQLLCKIHSPAACADGQATWRAAQVQYPELRGIPGP